MMSINERLTVIEGQIADMRGTLSLVHQLVARIDGRMERAAEARLGPPAWGPSSRGTESPFREQFPPF